MVNLIPDTGALGSPKYFIMYIVFARFAQTLMHETFTFWKFENKCDKLDVPSMKNFDAQRYFGRWYENKHTKEFEVFQPPDAKCVIADYIPNKDGTF